MRVRRRPRRSWKFVTLYVERSLPSEYEERFLLRFEGGGCLVPLLTVEGRRGLVGRFAVEEETGRGGGGGMVNTVPGI